MHLTSVMRSVRLALGLLLAVALFPASGREALQSLVDRAAPSVRTVYQMAAVDPTPSAATEPPVATLAEVSPLANVTAPPIPVLSASLLLQMLGFALLGGMILNIMPCVLPVISLKILGFVNQSKESPGRVRHLGLMYAVGVLASFLVMAGFIIGLKHAGKAVSWGIQFGNPQFLVVLTTLILLVALNLFGVFEVTFGGGGVGGLAQKEGTSGAFFNGVLAVVLATPCTAPFLSVAIGFAIPQPAAIVVLLFSTVGVGLALPYVFLSWYPAWLRFLPKPGLWMEHFKVGMGFPMLMTAMWLFWLAGRHFEERVVWLGFFLVMVSAAAWVFGQFVQRGRSRRGVAMAACFILLGVAYGWGLESELSWRSPAAASAQGGPKSLSQVGGIQWKAWSPEAVAEARAQGKPVLVDFSADWCAICNVNRRTSIEIPSVIAKLQEIQAVALLGDYTTTPDNITAELEKWQRGGVPLVIVYPRNPKLPGKALPEALTPGIVLSALTDAGR